MVQSAMQGAVAPLSLQLDSVIALLKASASPSTSTVVTLPSPTTVARLHARVGTRQKLGMNRETGRLLTGVDHLKQSIADIIYTRKGARLMRRGYGSALFERVDRTPTDSVKVGIIADVADALDQWEPRLQLARVQLTGSIDQQTNGQGQCKIIGNYLGAGVEVAV